MSSINLLRTQEHESTKTLKRKTALRIMAAVFLSFVAVFSVILFIVSIRISSAAVKKEQEATLRSLTLEKDKSAKYILLSDRLSVINQVLKTRKNYANTLSALSAEFAQGSTVTGLLIQDTDLTLTVSSGSLLSINDFLTKIINIVLKKYLIRDMTIETFTADRVTGTYSLSIRAKII